MWIIVSRRICSTLAAYHNMDSPGKEIDDLFPFRKTRDFIKNIDLPAAKVSEEVFLTTFQNFTSKTLY